MTTDAAVLRAQAEAPITTTEAQELLRRLTGLALQTDAPHEIDAVDRWSAKLQAYLSTQLDAAQPVEEQAPRAGERFQSRVEPWLDACFGHEIATDTVERNHRFVEESLELAQACGCTASEAHQLVEYVWGRPIGERTQEVGGVMVTLAALCSAWEIDMAGCGEVELERIWTMVEKIRAKQAAKPKHSPLAEARSRQPEQVSEPVAYSREGECDALTDINHTQWLALENVRLLAARHRKEDWAKHMLRFCEEAGNASRIIRAPHPAPALPADWQKIESAPKDGTEVLTLRNGNLRAIARFYKRGNVTGWHSPEFNCSYLKITHWQPLPAPPIKPQGGEDE